MALPKRKLPKRKLEAKKSEYENEYCFNCKFAEWNMNPENFNLKNEPFLKQCPNQEWRFLYNEKAKSCFQKNI